MGDSYEAKLSMGYRHLMGYGVPRSCESSVLYYSQVAEQVVKELVDRPIGAVIERSRLSDEKSRSSAPDEDDEVIQYYQHSAEAGDQGAQVALVSLPSTIFASLHSSSFSSLPPFLPSSQLMTLANDDNDEYL
jgi:SEL1 protein